MKLKIKLRKKNGGEPIKYKKDFLKIRFESDGVLPLGKILSIPGTIIHVGSVFQNGNKCYPQVCLYECVYEFVDELQKVCNSCTIYVALFVIFFMICISISTAFILNGTRKR